ncbi:unnamed protein product [Pelagomonas calceolata]|uniref:Uncharacterized protein n=1 Tax=Pelagomonas calceolata TaxID=35677 RepID=A0A8J2S981_9STRA|nr:unnamed protein product [Pelagomonas calceolata]
MRHLALTALAALAAASSPGGPDDAEAALRNLLTSLRPVYSKWKEAETPEQQPPAPPAVGAAPWVRAATDLRDATPADVALAALGGAARRPERRPERRRPNAPKRPPPAAAQPAAAPAADQAQPRPPPAAAQPPPVALAAQPPPAFAAAAAAWTAAHGKGAFYARDGEVLEEPIQQQERRGFWRPHAHVQQPPPKSYLAAGAPARPPQVEELHNKLKQFDEAGVMGAVYRGGACLFACGVLAFCSVAQPDRLTNAAYNLRYKETLGRILLCFAPSALLFLVVFSPKRATVGDAARAFHAAFFPAFIGCAACEVLVSSAVWYYVLERLEPAALDVVRALDDCPARFAHVLKNFRVPIKRRSQIISECLVSCVAAPLLEESAKLWACRRATSLREAAPDRGRQRMRQRRRQWMADTNDRIDDFGALDEPPHVHCYLTHCLAAAVGFKFVDAARRVCVYTRPRHPQKTFFAVIRGVVPIHELCGALTASRLARRDAAAAFNRRRPRGVKRRRVPSALMVIAPAAILRALANFRGCKPVFKWESNQPWVELQLQAWNQPDDATWDRVLFKSVASFGWWLMLARVLAYACSDYYRVEAEREVLRIPAPVVRRAK